MLILEEVLKKDTSRQWMPSEIAPTGARLICPDLDITIVFHSASFVVDQDPVGDADCNFDAITESAFAVVTGRFDLKQITRFGCRRRKVVGVDSIDDADKLSLKMVPYDDWRSDPNPELRPRQQELVSAFEAEDQSVGIRAIVKPFSKIGATAMIDARLRQPPHHLAEGQREALLEQLKRTKQRESDPEAGLLIDLDYYRIWPPGDMTVGSFLKEARLEMDRIEKDLSKKGKK
ncbi:MAG: hypothetical protein V3W34_06570 [Phycisphaerae bacterium]